MAFINLLFKFIDRITLGVLYLTVPFITFTLLYFFLRRGVHDSHISVIIDVSIILFININILGILIINKLNKIYKKIKDLIEE